MEKAESSFFWGFNSERLDLRLIPVPILRGRRSIDPNGELCSKIDRATYGMVQWGTLKKIHKARATSKTQLTFKTIRKSWTNRGRRMWKSRKKGTGSTRRKIKIKQIDHSNMIKCNRVMEMHRMEYFQICMFHILTEIKFVRKLKLSLPYMSSFSDTDFLITGWLKN